MPVVEHGVRTVAVDWSGAVSGSKRRIWWAEATPEKVLCLESGRTRQETVDKILAEAELTPRLVVGLDFAFSCPAWFLADHGLTRAHDLWALVDLEAEAWLASRRPPFWGWAGTSRPVLSEPFRRTERDIAAHTGASPKSVFQAQGPGAVGTGSLRGMPFLLRLHSAGFAIWPFDPPGWPRAVEIYPRVLTGRVNKSSFECRLTYLTRRWPDLHADMRLVAASSEDAFDAAVSARVMAEHVEQLIALPTVTEPEALLEGVIWQPARRPDRETCAARQPM